jgi:phosphoglycolate phosphatase
MIGNGELEEFDGISRLFENLRELNIGISITTGFPREILNPIIRELRWENLIDVSVAASEVNEGRPAPDMVFKSMEIYEELKGIKVSASEVAVIGDTPSDMHSGSRAGAKFVIGVTSGGQHPDNLFDFGATHVLTYATDLLTVVN